MQKRPFGKTGLQISPIGFGGAPIGFLETEAQQTSAVLNGLLDKGVNIIDTAAGYRGSEEMIGKTISNRRKEYVLISKCGHGQEGIAGASWSAELIKGTIDRSLKRLQTDRIDVMLLHSCDLPTLQKGEALGALVEARNAGKIRFAGYSGDNQAAAYAATLPDIAVIQTSVNIVDQANIDAVLPVTKKSNIGVMAKRPIANACWKDLSTQPGMYKDYVKDYTERLQQMKLKPEDVGLKDWTELALRFLLSVDGVSVGIIGTTNPKHVQRNLEIAEMGALSSDQVKKIRASFQSADPDEKWTGQT